MEARTLTRVVSNPAIMGGVPVVEGTRVPALNVLAEVQDRTSRAEIFRAYPSLPPDAIEACLAWDRGGRQC